MQHLLLALLLCAPARAQEPVPVLEPGAPLRLELTDAQPVVHTATLESVHVDAPVVGARVLVRVPAPGPFYVEARSSVADAYLVLRDAEGRVLAEDDDGLVGTHSQLRFVARAAGQELSLDVCALHGDRGPFEVVLRGGDPPVLDDERRAELGLEEARRRAAALEAWPGASEESLALAHHDLYTRLLERDLIEEARPHVARTLELYERVFGPDAPETLSPVVDLAYLHRAAGQHERAEPLFERFVDGADGLPGIDPLLLAECWMEVFGHRNRRRDLPGARAAAERALALREAALGPDSVEVDQVLRNLAAIVAAQEGFAAAEPLYLRGIAILEAIDPEHPYLPVQLQELALYYCGPWDLARAHELQERAVEIEEAQPDPDEGSLANLLDNLGLICAEEGDLPAARRAYERAIALAERTPEGPGPVVLGHLSSVCLREGDPAAALALARRGVALCEERLEPGDVRTAWLLDLLADVHGARGEFAAELPLRERVLALHEAKHGGESLAVSLALSELASNRANLGDLDAARRLHRRALAFFEAHEEEYPSQLSTTLNNLALVEKRAGDFAAARPLLERSIAIKERAGSRDPRSVATSVDMLASVLEGLGETAAARATFERALAMRAEECGARHPDTARSLNNLSNLLHAHGQLGAAGASLERALAILDESLGPEHPHTAQARANLALLRADQGELARAWELLWSGRDAQVAHLERALAAMSEGERFAYLATRLRELEVRLSLARLLDDAAVRRAAYEDVLAWKGRAGRLLGASRQRLSEELGPRQRAAIDALRACQGRLSKLAFATEVVAREDHDRRLLALRGERQRLEREFLALVADAPLARAPGLAEVRAALPPDGALLDLLVHHLYRPGAGGPGSWLPEPRVTCWITRPDAVEPVAVDLGPAGALRKAVARFLEELVGKRGVGLEEEAAGEEGAGDPAAALRALLWQPLAPHLEGANTLFVSPDDFLGTLPLGTLRLEDGTYLLERCACVYLGDARALAARPDEGPGFGSVLAVGGVDFRRSEEWAASGREDEAARSDLRGSFTDYWPRLPATAPEAEAVVALHEDAFGQEGRRLLLEGEEAGEARLAHELPRHAVLHLATHGFFQPEGVPSMWATARDEQGRVEVGMTAAARSVVGMNPGLLSGLVCSGANGAVATGAADGYLTAEEVGWLDLSGVELVVLSACETGLGQPRSGEGLIGLRRAFRAAGARTVVSSLWSVRDASTAQLMVAFYRNLWLEGRPRGEALRAAQLGLLEENRARHGAGLPATWGAFVLAGEWR